MAAPPASSDKLLEFLFRGQEIALDSLHDQACGLGAQVRAQALGAPAQPGRQRGRFHRPNANPHAVLLDGAHPRSRAGLGVEIVGDDQAQHIRRRTRRQFDQRRRALVRLAARHAQFEQPALGKQGQRLRGLADAVPIETAVDEEHRAVGISGLAGRRPHGVGGLPRQQRVIAGNQVQVGEAAPERTFELSGAQSQRRRARAAS